MSDNFRSAAMRDRYSAHKATGILERECVLCTAPSIRQFASWRVINNDFPYDMIATTHHMLVPKRHVTEFEITIEEWHELNHIKETECHTYDYLLEAVTSQKSIPNHAHIHLVVTKPLA